MKRLFEWFSSRQVINETGVYGSLGLLLLRIWVGLSLAFGHGLGKLANFAQRSAHFADPLGVGSTFSLSLSIFAEFFCSLALVLGLCTRYVTIPLIINMLVAALVIHGGDPFGRKELALMYLVPFITLLIAGPGKYSLDRLFTRK